MRGATMQGFKPGSRPKDKEKAGVIRGPGTGTSDSIKTEIPRGSYIMPADSTEKVGPEALAALGKSVPVKVSNGEYQMPPEQVHAVGVQALNQVRDATHTPVAAGFKPQEGALYFADGGAVESTDELIARISAKYGTRRTGSAPKAAPEPPPEAAREPTPQQSGGKPAATIGGAIGALRNRRKQIEEAAGFEHGGSPSEDEDRKTPSPGSGPSPQRGALALANERRIERMNGSGMYGQANADLANQAVGAFENTTTAIQGAGNNIAESYSSGGFPAAAGATARNAMVPALGFANDVGRGLQSVANTVQDAAKPAARAVLRSVVAPGAGLDPKITQPVGTAVKTAVTGDATPYVQPGQESAHKAPTVIPVSPEAQQQAKGSSLNAPSPAGQPVQPPAEQQGPAMGMRVRPTAVSGVNRIDGAPGLNSPLFTNRPTGQAVSEMQGGTVSSVGGFNPNALKSMARASAMNAENARIRQNRMDGRPDDWTPTKMSSEQQSAIYAQNNAYENADRERFFRRPAGERRYLGEAKQAGDMIAQQAREYGQNERLGMQEQGQNARAAATNSLEQQRIASDQQIKGFQAQGLQRMEKLYSAYESAKTPEERARIAEQIRVINGKDTEQQNRFTVVPGGQEVDPTTGMPITRPSMVINNQTGEFVNQQGGQQLPPISQNPAALKIAQNTALSREERAAQLRALGYQ